MNRIELEKAEVKYHREQMMNEARKTTNASSNFVMSLDRDFQKICTKTP